MRTLAKTKATVEYAAAVFCENIKTLVEPRKQGGCIIALGTENYAYDHMMSEIDVVEVERGCSSALIRLFMQTQDRCRELLNAERAMKKA